MLDAMGTRGVSPVLVGRDAELAALGEALRRPPSTVLIGGEAGGGKSRLVSAFAETKADAARVISGGCVELGGLPYAPFTAALRQLVRDIGADTVTGLLPGGVPGELSRLLPDLGRPDADADPEMARARLFEQVLTLLERLADAERHPVVLIIEDAHWADPSSRDLLSYLIRNQQTAAASMIIVTHRTDELHRTHPLRPVLAELDRLSWVHRLDLPRLRYRDVAAQIRAIAGGEPADRLVAEIYRRSVGNPLFVEALLAHDGGDLPESLADLLLTRVRQLPEQSQEVLRVAAAGGDRVDHTLLATVAGIDDTASARAVRPAVAANLLVVDGDGYAFRHALIREAVYAELLPGERLTLHTRYGEVLDDDPAALQEVAHHWYAARDFHRALPAAWRAATDAARSLAHAEQLGMLRRVLDLWNRIPDAAVRIGTDRLSVLEMAVDAADRAGEHQRGEALATAALATFKAELYPVRAARLLHRRSVMRWHLGKRDDLDDLRAAVMIAPADHPVRATALAALASRLMMIPRHEEARAAAEDALTVARRTGDAGAEAAAIIGLATLSARLGDFDQLARIVEAGSIAEATGGHSTLLLALHWQAHLLVAYGQGEQAARAARRGIAVAAQVGLARTAGALHAVDLVDALAVLGRWDDALEVVDHTLDLAPTPDLRAHLLRLQGAIALARGDLDVPAAALDEIREVVTARHIRDANETLPMTVLAIELDLARGNVADASATAEAALADYDIQQSSRFSWPLLVSMVRAAGAAGADPERAAAILAGARTHAGKLPVVTAVQYAHSVTFAAEAAAAEGVVDGAAWDAAAVAWRAVDQPYQEATALLSAAHAAATAGDRDGAAERLRRAAELADRLGARPLRTGIDDLARRARLLLRPEQDLPDNPATVTRQPFGLTPREMEVLRLVADGRSNRDIADELFISAKTASVHVSNILAKLGVAVRVEAAATAHRLHLFDD
jgi:DNA-binding CsgD family transcriptional regulator